MGRDYQVISADSHLEVPVDRWVHWVPEQYRDYTPKRIKLDNGADAQLIGDRVEMQTWRPDTTSVFDENLGAGTPQHRCEEQDLDGVDAELLFPGTQGVTNLLREIKDDAAYAAVVSAYNGWLANEYCAVAPDRLIGIGMIPDLDERAAVAELEHCAELGLKAIQVNGHPGGKPYPTEADDYFWAAATESDLAVTVHVCFGRYGEGLGRQFSGPYFNYPRVPSGPVVRNLADPVARFLQYGMPSARNLIPLIYSGLFDRFPSLRIYFAETEVGWVPQWLEHADDTHDRFGQYFEEQFGLRNIERLPSDYVKEHITWGAMHNPFGIRNRYEIGVDHIMWESDFPHGVTNWPKSQQTIEKMFAGVPADERHKMLAGNAIDFFHLA